MGSLVVLNGILIVQFFGPIPSRPEHARLLHRHDRVLTGEQAKACISTISKKDRASPEPAAPTNPIEEFLPRTLQALRTILTHQTDQTPSTYQLSTSLI